MVSIHNLNAWERSSEKKTIDGNRNENSLRPKKIEVHAQHMTFFHMNAATPKA